VSDWQLGIDFGTSYTVAAIAQGRNVTVIDVESNGRSRMPSSVFLNQDGKILVGTAAQHQASFAPERYEPTPKRSLGEGELFLGDRLVPVTELAAAVIRRVYTEASLQQGETAPSAVRMTHPANWGEARLDLLREAVEKAGISNYELIAEPVAAAARIGLLATTPGDVVAVYDFGGGTFDAAVLRRTDAGFEVAGPPAGRDPLGGEDIDQKIVEHLSQVLADGNEESWASLLNPADAGWRRKSTDLRSEVQRAKETLSEATVCQLWIPGVERDAQLTRDELQVLIQADIESTVDTLQLALEGAHVGVADLAGIYMVGGSSRIPLVADTIWSRLKMTPTVQENPKSIVAMGAAGWDILTEAARSPKRVAPHVITDTVPETEATVPFPVPTTAEMPAAAPVDPTARLGTGGAPYRSRLVMAVGVDSWSEGCSCVAEIELDWTGSPPTTVRTRDEPAATSATTEQRAAQMGAFRGRRTPGFVERGVWSTPVLGGYPGVERRFVMTSGGRPVEMFEQYLVVAGRAIIVACPETARDLGSQITLTAAASGSPQLFESPFQVALAEGWAVTERLTLNRNGTNHGAVAKCQTLPADVAAPAWRQSQIDELLAGKPQASIVSDVSGPVLNHFEGEIVTVRWVKDGVSMLTKRGLTTSDGLGYSVTINLPLTEQSNFSSLARQARLHPALLATGHP